VQDEAVLVEPLPALLACVHRLISCAAAGNSAAAAAAAAAAAGAGRLGHGSLAGSETWPGLDVDMDAASEHSSTAALKVGASA
jgi:hypothetical protein